MDKIIDLLFAHRESAEYLYNFSKYFNTFIHFYNILIEYPHKILYNIDVEFFFLMLSYYISIQNMYNYIYYYV